MQKNIYEISNLTCGYKDKETGTFVDVLDVEDVSVKRGGITIILGPSGSGKSTFMEAISLMSDTINDHLSENFKFYPEGQTNPINLLEIKQQNKELQKLRFDNFSFIFQDTNIMGNFDPRENVALPGMVYKPDGAIDTAEEILRDHLNLRLDLSKKAGEYSGGQKQRFAFARAFIAKGSVLFGDEPTGNLDKYNSEKLFWVIKQNVSEERESQNSINKIGAIIVTHSIDLALQFADRIIVIVKPEKFEDVNKKQVPGSQKEIIKGYVNPFFVYNNFNNTGEPYWREDTKGINLERNDFLPPIEDDGSNRFKYLEDENGTLIKDKLKNEIIFFLNNSYASAQKMLVEFAKGLNSKLQKINIEKKAIRNNVKFSDNDKIEKLKISEEEKSNLFNFYDSLKSSIINLIKVDSSKKMMINDFEGDLITRLKNEYESHNNPIYRKLFNDLIGNVEHKFKEWLE